VRGKTGPTFFLSFTGLSYLWTSFWQKIIYKLWLVLYVVLWGNSCRVMCISWSEFFHVNVREKVLSLVLYYYPSCPSCFNSNEKTGFLIHIFPVYELDVKRVKTPQFSSQDSWSCPLTMS
jgi:hypothetical protein